MTRLQAGPVDKRKDTGDTFSPPKQEETVENATMGGEAQAEVRHHPAVKQVPAWRVGDQAYFSEQEAKEALREIQAREYATLYAKAIGLDEGTKNHTRTVNATATAFRWFMANVD